MSLKKNQIEEFEKRTREKNADDVELERILNPIFIQRMHRYSHLMQDVYRNFRCVGDTKEGAFTDEQAFALTVIVLDNLLKSGSAQAPSGEKGEAGRAYA